MSENVNDGGRAFPFAYETESTRHISYGMTLRDYFAARAVQGMCSRDESMFSAMAIAKYGYKIADAMIEAREAT